jgi:hypothetical protein
MVAMVVGMVAMARGHGWLASVDRQARRIAAGNLSGRRIMRRTSGWALGGAGLGWFLSYVGARAVIESVAFGSGWVYVAAWLPAIPFVVVMVLLVRGIRGLDELERRIHLEALVVAFPLTMLVLMVLGLFELGLDLDRQNWGYRHVWAFLPVFYIGGLVLARLRYGQ